VATGPSPVQFEEFRCAPRTLLQEKARFVRSGPLSSVTKARADYLPENPLSTPTPVQKSHPVVALCVPQLPDVTSVKSEVLV
jgi:predicted short-subunit dehydrogenase-like oxidoreductase (DUF2520 family)